MNSLFTKFRSFVFRRPLVSGITVAVISFMLLNLSPATLAASLPALVLFLPCLLMLAVCMKHQTGGKCDKQPVTDAPKRTSIENPE